MSEEDLQVFRDVAQWASNPGEPPPDYGGQEYWWDLLVFFWSPVCGAAYQIKAEALDPFIEDFKGFFSNIWQWVVVKWGQLASWLTKIADYLEFLWTQLSSALAATYTWVMEKFEEVTNLIWNSFVLIWSQLLSEVTTFIDAIVAPIRKVWMELTSTLTEWLQPIWEAINAFMRDPVQWALDLGAQIWESIKVLGAEIWQAMIETANAVASWIGERISQHAPQFVEYLRDALLWIWEAIKAAFVFVKEQVIPAVTEATRGALGWLKDQFTHLMGLAYNEILDYAKSFVPMTPERAPHLALTMFGSAVGFGALAHGIALSVEAIPNLKYMGVHYMSSFAASMGGFGAIAGATMGVIAALAVRQPFTYYINSLLRPEIPDSRLLIEMRAKRELNLPQFKSYMKYHGYSDQWVDKIDSWLWKDPRLFEILYCADVTVPPRAWLERKFQKAGYEDIDIDVLCRVVDRRTTRSPRTYYTTALRRNFRHGFIAEEELVEGIHALEMAPDAVDWIKRAGELDNVYEVNSDLVTAYRTAYKNDILTEEEARASLASLGLPLERIEAILYLEWVRKTPSAIEAERKEIASQWAEVQAEYSRVYIESFRRGLITRERLVSYLVAIGYRRKVAEGTALLEEIKLRPKVKPEEIPTPVIPIPPEPPVYES